MKALKLSHAKDYVVKILRDQIYSGVIHENYELTQESLAKSLGVSRMPIREAISVLELEGLLERLPNRHMRVIGIKKKYIYNRFRLLCSIEKELSMILIDDDKDISALNKCFNDFEVAVSKNILKECAEMELNFHMGISKSIGDKYFIQLHNNLLNGYFCYALNSISMNWENHRSNLGKIIFALNSKNKAEVDKLFNSYFKEVVKVIAKEG